MLYRDSLARVVLPARESALGKQTVLYSGRYIFQVIQNNAVLKQHFRRYEFATAYSADKRVVDIGSELGLGAYYLAGRARFVLGIDNTFDWLELAIKLFQRKNLHFAAMDCAHLGLADGSFDVACLFEIIEHVGDPEKVLNEANRILKAGGTLLLSTPNRLSAAADSYQLLTGDHVREFSYAELVQLISGLYSEFEFYGQRSLEIIPLRDVVGLPHSEAFSRFLVVCRKK